MTIRMTAEDVRRITNKNLKGNAIEKHIANLDKQILKLAEEGKSEFDPKQYLFKLRTPAPSATEWEVIATHYRLRDFTWKDVADPDPGHYASHPYTILSW